MFPIQWSKEGLTLALAGVDYNLRGQKEPIAYQESLEAMKNSLQGNVEQVYTCQQTHSSRVVRVDGKVATDFMGYPQFEETDGLMTSEKGQALLVKFADCTPVVLYDPVKRAVAVVHSGWRGTQQRISLEAIRLMEKEVGSKRGDLFAYIGPCIDPKIYEVDQPVYEAFKDFPSRDEFFLAKNEPGKYFLQMAHANKIILKEAGLKEEQISSCKESTYTDPRLHSARKEGPSYGLNGLLVMMV